MKKKIYLTFAGILLLLFFAYFNLIVMLDIDFKLSIFILPAFIGGSIGYLVGYFLDNQDLKIFEKSSELQKSNILLKNIILSSPDLIMVHDKNHHIVISNKDEFIARGNKLNYPFCKTIKNKIDVNCPIIKVFENKYYNEFEKINLVEGKVHNMILYPIFDSKKEVKYVVTHATDITERKKLVEELKKFSYVDEVTEIANRRKFEEEYKREWKLALRNHSEISVILCDIDFFKKYNDFYGHQKGDEVLRLVAQNLKSVLKRETDIVARYGGEEFIILLPQTNFDGAMRVAEKLRSSIELLGVPHEKSLVSKSLTMSFGVSTIFPDIDTPKSYLIKTADLELYKAKGNGKNKVEGQKIETKIIIQS